MMATHKIDRAHTCNPIAHDLQSIFCSSSGGGGGLSHSTELNLTTPNASIPVPLGSGVVVFNRPCADVLREGGCDNPGDCAALVTTDVTQEPRANGQSIALFANFPDLHLVTANVTWQVHGLAVRFGFVSFLLLSTTALIRACLTINPINRWFLV
jgi:hypothetical protein